MRDVHSRRVIRKLDVWSVFKISFVFYLCVLVLLVAAGTGIWNVAAAFGVITTVDKSVRSLFALKSFQLHPMTALIWGTAIGGGICLLGVLFNVIASVFYNLISDLVGGIQVISVGTRDAAPRPAPPPGAEVPRATGSTTVSVASPVTQNGHGGEPTTAVVPRAGRPGATV